MNLLRGVPQLEVPLRDGFRAAGNGSADCRTRRRLVRFTGRSRRPARASCAAGPPSPMLRAGNCAAE